MNFYIHYETEEQKKELEDVLKSEIKNHFEDLSCGEDVFDEVDGNGSRVCFGPDKKNKGYSKASFENPKKRKYISVYVDNSVFFDDLQKAKESVYEQNKKNAWHYLEENPSDLPSTHRSTFVLYKRKDDSFGKGRYCDSFADGIPEWVDSLQCVINDVIAWKELESEEVLLRDFISDLEEQLSFVPKMEVQ